MFQRIAVLVSVLHFGGAAWAHDEITGGQVDEVVFAEAEAEVFEAPAELTLEMEPLLLTFAVQEVTFEPEIIIGVARPQLARAP